MSTGDPPAKNPPDTAAQNEVLSDVAPPKASTVASDESGSYPGGKGLDGVWQWLCSLMPTHSLYVEPFAGKAALLRHKPPALHSLLFEIDPDVCAWLEQLAWPGTTIRKSDGILFLETHQGELGHDALVYCDPPYLPETRVKKKLYPNEMDDRGHLRLLRCIQELRCNVMISGYHSALYHAELAGWVTRERDAITRGGTLRREVVWCNFDPSAVSPLMTVEYSALGVDYRERERVSRKIKRWVSRLRSMPERERRAVLLAALDAASPSPLASDDVWAHKPGPIVASSVSGSRSRITSTSAPMTAAVGSSPSAAAIVDRQTQSAETAGPGDARASPRTATTAVPAGHGETVTTWGVTAIDQSRPHVRSQWVLSLFPGIDLLGKGFEAEGFTVVRGPDTLWGGDIRDFHPTSGHVDGIIGGSPCQDFSRARRAAPTGYGLEMLSHFCRCVVAAKPSWFLLENVPTVPTLRLDGYRIQRLDVRGGECGCRQRRLRHFQFGSADGLALVLRRQLTSKEEIPAALASEGRRKGRRPWSEFCALQGLASGFDLPGFTMAEKYRAVGNAVPFTMARFLAAAIRDNLCPAGECHLCPCGCGRPVEGKAKSAGVACRKRLERSRKGRGPQLFTFAADSHVGGVTQLRHEAAPPRSITPPRCKPQFRAPWLFPS